MATTNHSNPRGAFAGVKPSHFLDTTSELHALVNGLADTLCPWPPLQKFQSQHLQAEIWDEYHYYQFGRILGLLAWIAIILLLLHSISGMVRPAHQTSSLATPQPVP